MGSWQANSEQENLEESECLEASDYASSESSVDEADILTGRKRGSPECGCSHRTKPDSSKNVRKLLECASATTSTCGGQNCCGCGTPCALSRSQRKAAARCATHSLNHQARHQRRKQLMEMRNIKSQSLSQRIPGGNVHVCQGKKQPDKPTTKITNKAIRTPSCNSKPSSSNSDPFSGDDLEEHRCAHCLLETQPKVQRARLFHSRPEFLSTVDEAVSNTYTDVRFSEKRVDEALKAAECSDLAEAFATEEGESLSDEDEYEIDDFLDINRPVADDKSAVFNPEIDTDIGPDELFEYLNCLTEMMKEKSKGLHLGTEEELNTNDLILSLLMLADDPDLMKASVRFEKRAVSVALRAFNVFMDEVQRKISNKEENVELDFFSFIEGHLLRYVRQNRLKEISERNFSFLHYFLKGIGESIDEGIETTFESIDNNQIFCQTYEHKLEAYTFFGTLPSSLQEEMKQQFFTWILADIQSQFEAKRMSDAQPEEAEVHEEAGEDKNVEEEV